MLFHVARAKGKFKINDATPLALSEVPGPYLEHALAECRSKLKVLGVTRDGLLQVLQT